MMIMTTLKPLMISFIGPCLLILESFYSRLKSLRVGPCRKRSIIELVVLWETSILTSSWRGPIGRLKDTSLSRDRGKSGGIRATIWHIVKKFQLLLIKEANLGKPSLKVTILAVFSNKRSKSLKELLLLNKSAIKSQGLTHNLFKGI